jgi:syntaxin 1B/2/3
MSYAQYQQYGGNPYNQGPDAEAGQGGNVSFSLEPELPQCAQVD